MNKNLFDKLAAQESDFMNSQFMCPVTKGQPIRVRLAGVIMTLEVVRPKKFQGWGVFQALTPKTARLVRQANMTEQQAYLALFPTLQLILCRHNNDIWYGFPANQPAQRFQIHGIVPVRLAEEVQLFEVIQARFDGNCCWFEGPANSHNPRTAQYLRESLQKFVQPDKLELPGLTKEETEAYQMAYWPALEADIEAKKDRKEEWIKESLRRAGAQYRSYIERGNTFTVEYLVDGDQHRTVVNKDTLAVQSAGICLSGGDSAFDLQSLVGVIKEGTRRGRIVRVGNNVEYGDDDYD